MVSSGWMEALKLDDILQWGKEREEPSPWKQSPGSRTTECCQGRLRKGAKEVGDLGGSEVYVC